MKTNPLVVDLSHWDPAENYQKLKAAGIPGVIYKATQGIDNRDSTYLAQRDAALSAGMLWGAYHFADGTDVSKQADNFLNYAGIEKEMLFALDFEDNQSNSMSITQAHDWIDAVETKLGRPGQCVFYSSNRVKDQLGNRKDSYLGARRLWLAQYSTTPVVQASWSTWWLWQYTDGQYGPGPYAFPGVDSGGVDCNSYQGTPEQLASEWATGQAAPPEPVPTPIAPMAFNCPYCGNNLTIQIQ